MPPHNPRSHAPRGNARVDALRRVKQLTPRTLHNGCKRIRRQGRENAMLPPPSNSGGPHDYGYSFRRLHRGFRDAGIEHRWSGAKMDASAGSDIRLELQAANEPFV